ERVVGLLESVAHLVAVELAVARLLEEFLRLLFLRVLDLVDLRLLLVGEVEALQVLVDADLPPRAEPRAAGAALRLRGGNERQRQAQRQRGCCESRQHDRYSPALLW